MKVVLVTGASSGIGFSACKLLAQKGYKVYGAARRVEKMEPLKEFGVVPIYMDLTDEASLEPAVKKIIAHEGRLDALVNNAGYGALGAIETTSMASARRQLDVNLFGAARLTQLVIPQMRKQGSGRIVIVTSLVGKVPLLYGGWYTISKFSTEALGLTLAMELKQFGIKVSMVAPGSTNTEWGNIAAENLEQSSDRTPYEETALNEARLFRKFFSTRLFSSPDVVAKAIVKAVTRKRPKIRYRVATFGKAGAWMYSLMPTGWWNAMMRLLGTI